MRTTTIIAAALALALAACGGDGGLSLTEPHQLDLSGCVEAPGDFPGIWIADEWGCEIRAIADGGPNCDPGSLTLSDGEQIAVASIAGGDYSMTIRGETVTAYGDANSIGGDLAAGGHVGIMACADGSALMSFDADDGSTFLAFAHRR